MSAPTPTVPIRDIVRPVVTWNPKSNNNCNTFRYIDIASIDRESRRITDAKELACAVAPSRARQLVETGDIVISTVRPNLNGVAHVPEVLHGATASTGFCVLRVDPQKACSRYLFHWVASPSFVADMSARATGQSYPAVSDAIIKDSTLPLPPLPEQKRIADILDKADAIRRKRAQALELTDQFLQSVFLDMFGDIRARKCKFPIGTVRKFVKAQSGKSSKKVLSDTPTGIQVYGGNGINGWATEALFHEPVIVAGRVGQQCGIIHATEGPAWVTDNAIVIEITDPEHIDPVYLATAFQMSPIRDTVTHLDLPFINQSMLLDHPLPIPPLGAQTKYATVHRKVIETQKAKYGPSLQSATQLFDALVQRAFRGEL